MTNADAHSFIHSKYLYKHSTDLKNTKLVSYKLILSELSISCLMQTYIKRTLHLIHASVIGFVLIKLRKNEVKGRKIDSVY